LAMALAEIGAIAHQFTPTRPMLSVKCARMVRSPVKAGHCQGFRCRNFVRSRLPISPCDTAKEKSAGRQRAAVYAGATLATNTSVQLL
jgi:hypothetical protein